MRTNSVVHEFVQDKIGTIKGVRTQTEEIFTQTIILATNAYSAPLWPPLEPWIVPTRGQVLLTAPVSEAFPFACATDHDLQYWRQTRSGQILFGGCRRLELEKPFGKGTDSTDTTPEVQDGLRKTFLTLFPDWQARIKFEKSWAGTMAFTPDYKPIVGSLPGHKNVLIGAGFSGNGLPLVCITAKLLREIIVQECTSLPLAWFDPSRFLSRDSSGEDKD